MGLTRQGVQKVVNQLLEDELAVLVDNRDHRTSPIVELTDEGRRVDDAISSELARRNNRDARRLDEADLEVTSATLRRLCELLSED